MPTFMGTNGDDGLLGGPGDDLLMGLEGDDILNGGGGNDRLEGGAGADIMVGGAGDDQYFVDKQVGSSSPNLRDRVIEEVGGGYDRVYVSSTALNWRADAGSEIEFIQTELSAYGNEFGQILSGSRLGGTQYLDGAGGDDTLYGYSGNDFLTGGSGADRFIFSSIDLDFITDFEAGIDLIVLETGDLSAFYALTAGSISPEAFALGAATTTEHRLILRADGWLVYDPDGIGSEVGNAFISVGSATVTAASFLVVEGSRAPTVIGTDGKDTLLGAGEIIDGLGGDDDLSGGSLMFGGDGNDILRGGFVMEGGAGDDIYFVFAGRGKVRDAAGDGNDRIYVAPFGDAVQYALLAGQEIETLSTTSSAGTAAIDLTGNGFGQYIYGNDGTNLIDGQGGDDYLLGFGGNDRIFGGAGADIMDGGAGDDLIYVDNAYDRVFESIGAGNDRVIASTTYMLAAGQEIETLSTDWTGGSAAIDLAGNERNQNIYGNDGANFLDGREGNDVLQGHGGNDILYGGAGADEMYGGAGDDVFYVDNGSGGGDLAYESVGQGSDRVLAGSSYTLLGGQEIETLSTDWNAGTTGINLTGNEFGQAIYGNAGVNELDGKGGADTLLGGGGADVFLFTTGLGGGNVDQIADFVSGVDDIYLDDAIFSAVGRGALAAGSFATGTAATDADDRIIYDPATGNLFYDADGNGAAAAIMFASLGAQTTLFASDIIVI